MVAHIKTVAFLGVDAVAVDVQVHLAPGHNAFTVVGLPDKSVAESRERVRAALSAMGLALPYERITINLSPADLPKEGSHYDLPIALGLLVAMGALTHEQVAPFVAMGELALDGACTPVPGALPAAMAALENNCGLICPAACGPEAAWSGLAQPDRPGIVAGGSLLQIVNHLRGTHLIAPPEVTLEQPTAEALDMADIRGQGETRMALEVAAAGGHISYQARFQLVAAMNPCRCGYAEDPDLACHRLPICRQEYIGRLSGPLLDRFDVRVNVPPVPLSEMMGSEKGEASTVIAARVGAPREVQMARQNCLNAHLDGEALYKLAAPDTAGQNLLDRIADTKN